MKATARRFNLFLAATALALLCGCQTTDKPAKAVSALRVHVEAAPDHLSDTETVSVLRGDPLRITIAKEPILTEANIIAAKVVDTPGGFGIQIHFDETSALLLEQYSADSLGKHFAIFGQWGEKLANGRWLAAPLITHRIADGTLTFTPDMSRAEAERLVLGLNNVANNIRKGELK